MATASKTMDIIIKATDQTASATRSAANSLDVVSDAAKRLAIALAPIAAAFAAKEVIDATMAWESYGNSLEAITGSAQKSSDELDYLREVSGRLGLDLESTAKAYINLAASSKSSGLEGEKIKAIFEAVSGTMNVLGKSSADTEGALYAIGQMFSKGNVQAEELRGQLGERLPGAFDIFAKANGVTTKELNKMLESGNVLASETLPKFAAELMRVYGPDFEKAAFSTRGELNKFNSALFDLKIRIGEAGVIDGFVTSLKAVQGVITHPDFLSAFNDLASSFKRIENDMGGTGEAVNAIVKVFELLALGIQTVLVPIQLAGDLLGSTFAAISLAAEGDLKAAWAVLKDTTPGDNFRANMAALETSALRVSGAIDTQKEAIKENSKVIEQSAEPTKNAAIATDTLKKSTDESAKSAENLKLKLLELASDERIKSMEFQASINIAQVQADAEKAKAVFDTLSKSIESSGNLLTGLWDKVGSVGGTAGQQLMKMIEEEFKLRQESVKLANEGAALQNELAQKRIDMLDQNGGLINITADGLAPELEAFMFKILERIQMRVAGEYGAFLMGI